MNVQLKNSMISTFRVLIPHSAIALSLCVFPLTVSADPTVKDEDISIDFLKEQLARSRAAAGNSEAAVPPTENIHPANLDQENARLLAEENALLNSLSGEKSAPAKPAPAAAAIVPAKNSSPEKEKTTTESARASADFNKALKDLAASRGTPSFDEDNTIEVIRSKPGRVVPATNQVAPNTIEDRVEIASGAKQESTAALATNKETQTLTTQINAQSQTLVALQRTNSDLRRQLEANQRRVKESSKELEETRNRLIIAETEVERLSNIIEARNNGTLQKFGVEQASNRPATREYRVPQTETQPSAKAAVVKQVSASAPSAIKSDMLIATVTEAKAHLRTGPGKNNSPLMTVSKGTRLAVETRNGEWYRVITPTGARAWVSSDVVSFGPGSQASPTRTIRTSGYVAPISN